MMADASNAPSGRWAIVAAFPLASPSSLAQLAELLD
jgi:hypothetical protein